MKVRSNRLYICYVTANRLEALTPALTSCCKGPGYKSPLDAMRNGPRETIVYVPCIVPPDSRQNRCNYLATVDVDPQSITYGKVGLPISAVTFCKVGLPISAICQGRPPDLCHHL